MSDKKKTDTGKAAPGKIAKMKDVAAHAGVSIKTVSRVLNNEPYVQDAVRQKVRDAVRALNYVPSQSARSLRGARSYNISLICHAGGSTYVNQIQFGAMVACQRHGYQLSLALMEDLGDETPEEIRGDLERMTTVYKPDGVLLIAPYSNDHTILVTLAELGIPVTCVGPLPEGESGAVVQIDEHAAARELTEHLIALGHKKIGFIRGVENQQATHVRYAAFSEAMAEAGLEVRDDWVKSGDFQFESGFAAGEEFFASPDRPTAVFAANDDMAAGLITAARDAGVDVPGDLSVVGFDDSSVAVRMRPQLTTVRQPIRELGERAIDNFVHNFGRDGELTDNVLTLPYELVLRDTTAPPKG